MNCNKFEKYILLKKEGLNQDELSLLEKHLQTCDSCRKFLESTEKFGNIIDQISQKEPILTNPGLLTGNILRSIKELETNKPGIFENLMERFLNWFFAPLVRPVLVSFAVFMISWFLYQETQDQIQIAGLENQLKKYSVNEYVAAQESQKNYIINKAAKIYNENNSKGEVSYLKPDYHLMYSSFGQIDKLYNFRNHKFHFRNFKNFTPSVHLKLFSDSTK